MDFSLETKEFSAPFELKGHDESGSFEGHAAIFNKVDQMKETIIPGAFKKTLKGRSPKKIKMLRGHKRDSIIGVWTELREDSKGLFAKGQLFLDLVEAKETFLLMKEGVLDSMSVGFLTVLDQFNTKTGIRELLEINLFEVSMVTFPAQPGALVMNVKDFSPEKLVTKRDLEEVLRNAGFSVSTSKFICAGWTPPALRDVEGGQKQMVERIRRVTKSLQAATGT